MLSLKHCSGLWFTAAGTGSEETAIDKAALAGGGWHELGAVTEGLQHVSSSLAMSQTPGREETRCLKHGLSNSAPMTCLVHPLPTLFPLLALSSVKSSQPKPSHSVYSLWKGFDFWSEWLVMQSQVQEQGECPTTGSLVHGGVQKKKSSLALLQCPFLLSH